MSPLASPDTGKNPAAVALGRLGGQKGEKARAARLTRTTGQRQRRGRHKLSGGIDKPENGVFVSCRTANSATFERDGRQTKNQVVQVAGVHC